MQARGMATQAELLGARKRWEAAQAALETNDRERDGLRRELPRQRRVGITMPSRISGKCGAGCRGDGSD